MNDLEQRRERAQMFLERMQVIRDAPRHGETYTERLRELFEAEALAVTDPVPDAPPDEYPFDWSGAA